MIKTENRSYIKALKATTIFGGVQVFVILFQILKTKAVAILIGVAGMGILGLINQTATFITSITSFGLESSSVKNISLAEASGDNNYLNKLISVFQKLIYYTALLGLLFGLSLAPILSKIIFNNYSYVVTFIIVAFSIFFTQLTVGKSTLLQGLRKTKLLAKSSILSASIGLVVSLPIYYFLGVDGIAISIIISAISNYLITFYLCRQLEINKVSFDQNLFNKEGKNMLKMGLLISLSSFLSIGAAFILRIYMSKNGGLSEVGLYSAGFVIIEGYVGILFTAMAKDYYPRLSMVSNNQIERNQVVNQQIEISILLLIPILTIFLLSLNIIIKLLYTSDFFPAIIMIQYAILGMFFRAISWAMGYLLLAKGDSKIFFWSELISTIYIFTFNILGYKYFGLKGIGYAFILIYFVHTIQIYSIARIYYNFKFDNNLVRIFVIATTLITIQFFIIQMSNINYKYIMGLVIFSLSCFYSFKEFNNKTQIFKSYFLLK